MKRIFIGHRGVGKTSFLKRHLSYFSEVPHFDLDFEIEKESGKKISDIFLNEGESAFRNYEIEIFSKLTKKEEFAISVGAGFDVNLISSNIEIIFISRRTDSDGRIFLNRPKINSELSDLDDSFALYKIRHPLFSKKANWIYHMPEGLVNINEIERKIFSKNKQSLNYYLTVCKNNLFELKYNNIELRTDILSNDEIESIVLNSPYNNFIISYRSLTKKIKLNNKNVLFDWGLELGSPSRDFMFSKNIISIHEGSIKQCIEKLSLYTGQHLKLCPLINSWSELEIGYAWQQQDKDNRSFLPRTDFSVNRKSLWRWYRLIAAEFQKINFIQGNIENDDQPSLFEILSYKLNSNLDHKSKNNFGAVLGNPIHHSYSPQTQGILSVPLAEADFSLAIYFLQKLGLNYAAVTSPLKKQAGILCGYDSESFNSIVFKNKKWIGCSTDQIGFEKIINQLPIEHQSSIAVWGGSGILSALLKVNPKIQCYSSRTGAVKNECHKNNPNILIWAAPRNSDVKYPWQIYLDWNPQIILDLNYTENSMGLECAKKYQCKYISGLEMFFEQAKYQKEFWKENL